MMQVKGISNRAFFWAAAVSIGAGASSAQAAASLIGLGDLPGGSVSSSASNISADGSVVVGSSNSASGSEAFRWTSGTGMVALGDLPGGTFNSYASAASANGSVVVGYGMSASGLEAFRRTGAGMVGLGDLPGGNFESYALDVSADGSVVVGRGWGMSSGGYEAFRWTNAGMANLGHLPGGTQSSASAVSADGSVVVGDGNSTSGRQVFRWTSAGMVGLPDLAGGNFFSTATDVNADGTVIVGSGASSSGAQAARWVNGSVSGLGDLPGGDFASVAQAVSDNGSSVVGWGTTSAGLEAFRWTADSGIKRVWDVLVASGLNPAADGWSLLSVASGISADGKIIVGSGTRNGQSEAFLAILSEPARTLYWDLNGTTPGAGGVAPSGSWSAVGSTPGFNTDSTGGAAGTTIFGTTDADTLVFTAGNDGGGTFTVTVSAMQSAATVQVSRGNITFTGGTINTGAFNVAANASATVSSIVTGGSTSTLTKTGAGTLKLSGVNTHTIGTTVSAGTLIIANPNAIGSGGLSVGNAATAQVAPGLPKAVSAATVATTGSGQIDLTSGSMVIKNSNLSAVQAMVTTGYANSAWNGAGINSSVAASDPNFVTAIGYASNADAFYTEFQGVTGLDGNDVLVRVTYLGDSDLNGDTNLDDFPLFTAGLEDDAIGGANVLPSTWFYGDYDYNGVVNLDDFPLFTYGLENDPIQLAALADLIEMSSLSTDHKSAMLSLLAGVPEPATLSLLGIAGSSVLTRRRRR